jgi:catechol 2,3-dioxygenase-like lactoylglutathione lyase family enzyme
MAPYLEHVNLTVPDLDEALEFIRTALPEFRVRGRGEAGDRSWVHVGTEETYLALEGPAVVNSVLVVPAPERHLNHLGFVVDDLEGVRARLRAAGYEGGEDVDPHPYRKRTFFRDRSGQEYEFVQYLSEDWADRNWYE